MLYGLIFFVVSEWLYSGFSVFLLMVFKCSLGVVGCSFGDFQLFNQKITLQQKNHLQLFPKNTKHILRYQQKH